MGNFKKERKMKVYAQSGYKYKDTATIILKGDWLEDCGFEPGTPIRVECEVASEACPGQRCMQEASPGL